MSRSADECVDVTVAPVSMVGTVASRTTASIRPAPPRADDHVDQPRAWMRWVTLERGRAGQQLHGVFGQALAASALRSTVTSSALDFAAEELPAAATALPDFSVTEGVDGDIGPAS